MIANETMKIYPRLDKTFKKKKSLSYDFCYSEIFEDSSDELKQSFRCSRWIVCFFIGFITASLAFFIERTESGLVHLRNYLLDLTFKNS